MLYDDPGPRGVRWSGKWEGDAGQNKRSNCAPELNVTGDSMKTALA